MSTTASAFNPLDYAGSPVHYAVALGDHQALSKLLSSLPKIPDPTRSQSETDSIAQECLADQLSAVLDGRDNTLRETPLHLAVRLNDAASTRLLAAAGADASLQNSAGWNPLHEAVLRRHPEIVSALAQHHQLSAWKKWRRRRPILAAALRRTRDFYTEISFRFESSVVPLVGKLAPSDTYRIWKRGGSLRADTTLSGFDGLKIQRTKQSFLFLNDEHRSEGGLVVVNHDDRRIHDAFERDSQISNLLSETSVYRAGIDVTGARLVGPRTNWRGQEKTESVGEWKARVYDMDNVRCNFRSRKVNTRLMLTEKEYTKSVRPTVWLTDGFPLKTEEELVPLLDVLADKLKPVRRIRDILTTTFPKDTFPVKIAIPVVPTVRVVITFTKFVHLVEEESFYTPPSSPTQLININQEDSTMTTTDSSDPFAIPSDYTWGSYKDKSK